MKFLHTADWHIGKKLHQFDLISQQKEALEQLLAIAKKEAVDAIIVAGDLYDRALPSKESVALVNEYLYKINMEEKFPLFVISGNHDSGVRLATGSPWYKKAQFYLATEIEESLQPITFLDSQIYLLPYVELFDFQKLFPKEKISDLPTGYRLLVEKMQESFLPDKKHLLVGHFFANGALTTDSETKVQVGGLLGVPTELFKDFDYVALGHLHNPNALKSEKIRYSGSLYPYSLSEERQEKGCRLIETTPFKSKFIPFNPQQKVVQLKGSFEKLMTDSDFLSHQKDFVGIHLTDKQAIFQVMAQLQEKYPFILELTRNQLPVEKKELKKLVSKNPQEIFQQFYEETTGEKLTVNQEKMMTEIWVTLLKETQEK